MSHLVPFASQGRRAWPLPSIAFLVLVRMYVPRVFYTVLAVQLLFTPAVFGVWHWAHHPSCATITTPYYTTKVLLPYLVYYTGTV